MESTIGRFETRREAELAIEHVVQEYGVERTDVFVQPAGRSNTAGTGSAGADSKASPGPDAGRQLEGEWKYLSTFTAMIRRKLSTH